MGTISSVHYSSYDLTPTTFPPGFTVSLIFLCNRSRTYEVFATAGVFPVGEEGNGFTDVRLKQDEFESLRGTGDLAKNLNRVPVLNHNGFVLGQSTAIARYLGRHFGLYGRTLQEAAEIDAMMAHVDDVKNAWRKLFPYRVELTDEQKAENNKVWFDTPSEPPIEGRKERQLQWFLEKIESVLPGDGYSVGGRPSIADAYWFNLLLEQAFHFKLGWWSLPFLLPQHRQPVDIGLCDDDAIIVINITIILKPVIKKQCGANEQKMHQGFT